MGVIQVIAGVLNFLLLIYVFVLLGRLVLEWIPRGFGLVLAEVVYTVTDPPIRLFRRFIPPLRVGAVAIDFGFALTMLLCFILLSVTRTIAAG